MYQHFKKHAQKIYRMVAPDEGRAVLDNFGYLCSIQAVTYILPVLILPYLFRVIGPGKFGLIAFAQAFVQYFVILTDYGFNISATKEIALCRHDHLEVCRVFSSVMAVKLVLALIGFCIFAAIVFMIPKFQADWPVYILSFGAVAGNTLFPAWFFQGLEKMKHIAYINICGGLAMLLLVLFFVRRSQDYLWIPLISSVVALVTGIWAQRVVFKKFGISFYFSGYRHLRRQLAAGWDIFISNVAINAYTATRVFVVGLLTNTTITGFYAIAEKLSAAFISLPLFSLSQAVFPRMSKIFHKNKMLAVELMQSLQHLTTKAALVILALFFVFAPAIVRIFCGADYYSSVLSLRLLLLAVFIISANAFRVQFLLVCGKTHIYSRIHVLMSMIGLPLIFLLVAAFGFAGAALASIIIEAGIFTITYFTVRRLKFA